MIQATSGKHEPRGCTLADLILLTVGVAVAIAARWYTFTGIGGTTPYVFDSAWLNRANVGAEGFQKVCGALVPLILYRRWRFGGPIRPAEYLPMFAGVRQLVRVAQEWPVFGIYHTPPKAPVWNWVDMAAFHRWNLALVALGCLAAVSVVARRRRLDGITGLLLVVAWTLLAVPGEYYFTVWADARIKQYLHPLSMSPAFKALLMSWPIATVADLPIAAAVWDFARRFRRAWPWYEWASIGLGALWFVLFQVRILGFWCEVYSGRITLHFLSEMIPPFVSLATSFAIARWTEPAWRRFLLGEIPAGNPGESATRSD